ncbi:maker626 [Drosophila busckii]|uniref:Maker626 n=1 Tax=Drosophila busckii TaxID=30019 RepID=A0A0M3QUB9_DROBS|nr:microfibril-associated glycoprotein 4 [Drosophila busckii]ALC40393.1 maker626 [Drosophila busckii]
MRLALYILAVAFVANSHALPQDPKGLGGLNLHNPEVSIELLHQSSRINDSQRGYPSSCPAWEGIFTITTQYPNLPPFKVLCDSTLNGPGWLVVARRFDGSVNFFRNWTLYKEGFGDLSGEFFIGLDKLQSIVSSQQHELYVYLQDFDGQSRYARYDDFIISSEKQGYQLQKLGTYSGDANDALRWHEGHKFSTFDMDYSAQDCSPRRMGAYWYGTIGGCTDSNLFGMYLNGEVSEKLSASGITWYLWRGKEYSYKFMQMMVRPKYYQD